MKFALLILSIVNTPQYIAGPFNSMDECQAQVRFTPAGSKAICLPMTPRK